MLDKLIEEGKNFENQFTEEYTYGVSYGIKNELKSDYLKWLAKLGTYAEGNLEKRYPKMTEIILSMINKKSIMNDDFDIISGYLDSVKEQEDTIQENSKFIWDLNK
ncbi:hypothetical protein QYB77_003010 [Clostridium perfringens]|nr:hypothetical protein [Clostridium perfringens]ELC8460801.1 hypothetical protein [Clostridium perfringens]